MIPLDTLAQRPEFQWTDEMLVRAILDGDLDLFEVILRRYNQRLYRVCRSILSSNAEAEDVVQETYVRAFRNLRQFRGEAKFSTWLTKIAVYESLARARKSGRHLSFEQDADLERQLQSPREPATSPEDEAHRREVRAILEEAIGALAPERRAVFILREVEGLSTRETAECLGLSEANVKVRLHRGRRDLRRFLRSSVQNAVSGTFEFLGDRCDAIVLAVTRRLSGDPLRDDPAVTH